MSCLENVSCMASHCDTTAACTLELDASAAAEEEEAAAASADDELLAIFAISWTLFQALVSAMPCMLQSATGANADARMAVQELGKRAETCGRGCAAVEAARAGQEGGTTLKQQTRAMQPR